MPYEDRLRCRRTACALRLRSRWGGNLDGCFRRCGWFRSGIIGDSRLFCTDCKLSQLGIEQHVRRTANVPYEVNMSVIGQYEFRTFLRQVWGDVVLASEYFGQHVR